VIERFVEWIKHRDLARVTPQDAVRWRDHMISQGIAPKAVRDVWLAAPRSVATHMLNALRLEINPSPGSRSRVSKPGRRTTNEASTRTRH
jgi:hypothetical protein